MLMDHEPWPTRLGVFTMDLTTLVQLTIVTCTLYLPSSDFPIAYIT